MPLKSKFLVCWLILILLPLAIKAQEVTQIVRGKITDSESGQPLPGVSVLILKDSIAFKGATTNEKGLYALEGIPTGRLIMRVSFIGYRTQFVPLFITSAKEVIQNVTLEESATALKEIEVKATAESYVLNEMTTVSAKTFNLEETMRYAGSRGDPARMASNFAGVQGGDDSRNDIVVRGNSPLGVLWRLEGIDIPNPNHFAIAGSSGGPVSTLNNKLIGNSDFFTGAFPADYGNSTSGVFDLKFRNGNNQKHEFNAQFGFLGTEVGAEGPINKEKGSSYLFAYRYSTVSLFSLMGISIGTDAVPKYQDASFKLNFPGKNESNFSIFGLGGMSDIAILISDQKDASEIDLYGENDRDQFFGTRMGVLGATYSKALKNNAFVKSTLAYSYERQKSEHFYIERQINTQNQFQVDSIYPILDYTFLQSKLSHASTYNKKFGPKDVLKVGYMADLFLQDFKDSAMSLASQMWATRWNYEGNAALIHAFAQWKHKFTDRLALMFGLHNQFFTLNNTYSLAEPRLGMRYDLNEKSSLNAGLGLHSQLQPMYTYFYQQYKNDGTPVLHNQNMDMSKSLHYVLGYNRSLSRTLNLKSELYYQQLYNIPVEITPMSFSMVNQGSGFQRFFPDSLQNTGTGYNYGVELTIERTFTKGYFFMFTGSVFNSRYKGSDGVERNTDFNGNFVLNGLAQKEFKIKDRSFIGVGTKVTYAGSRRYGEVDMVRSEQLQELVFLDSAYNEKQFPPYFRLDAKVNFVFNREKVTHEIGLDLVNILGTRNILSLTYAPVPGDPTANPIRENYQLGFLPIFFYRIDF
ncbi:MAG: TonB-dependent receptor [Flavobacteriales bacterium]